MLPDHLPDELFVTTLAVSVGGFLVWWGIDILRTGYRLPAAVRPPALIRLKPLARALHGILTLAVGLALLGVVLRLQASTLAGLGALLFDRGQALLFSGMFLGTGSLALWRPGRMLRSSVPDEPHVLSNRASLTTVRLIGVAFILFGLVILFLG